MLADLLERTKPTFAKLAKKLGGDPANMNKSRPCKHQEDENDVLASLNDSDFCG